MGPTIAKALAHEGMNLVLCARSRGALEAVAEEICSEYGVAVHVLPIDLGQAEVLEPMISEALSLTGQIDVLVNNAAVAAVLPYERTRVEDIERELRVNLITPLLLSRLVLPLMLAQGRGHIVTISSLNAEVPLAFFATYAATKAGLAGLVRSLRQELRGRGVSATVVMPGVVWNTGMVNAYEGKSAFRMTRLAGGCTPEQIGRAVVRGIARNLPEVIVNVPPVRPFLAMLRLLPKSIETLMYLVGAQKPAEAAVKMNLEAHGALTGVSIAPDCVEQIARLRAGMSVDRLSQSD